MSATRLDTARDALRLHGVGGVARRAAHYVQSELRLRLWRDEHHVVHVLELAGERPRRELPDGLRLVAGDQSHLHHLPTIPATGQLAAREWLEGGARLFLVLDAEEHAAFAGWVFHGELPLSVSPRGAVALPDHAAGFEEFYTAAPQRGRGIAPAAISLIADRLEADGDSMVVAAAGAKATGLRRAVEKAGMRPVGDLYTRRRLDVARMRLEPTDEAGRRLAVLWSDEPTF